MLVFQKTFAYSDAIRSSAASKTYWRLVLQHLNFLEPEDVYLIGGGSF